MILTRDDRERVVIAFEKQNNAYIVNGKYINQTERFILYYKHRGSNKTYTKVFSEEEIAFLLL